MTLWVFRRANSCRHDVTLPSQRETIKRCKAYSPAKATVVTVELCKDLRFFTRTVVFKNFCGYLGAVGVTSVQLYLYVLLVLS